MAHFLPLQAARVHYVEGACAKQFHPKTNPYKFEFDEKSGHFKCRYDMNFITDKASCESGGAYRMRMKEQKYNNSVMFQTLHIFKCISIPSEFA